MTVSRARRDPRRRVVPDRGGVVDAPRRRDDGRAPGGRGAPARARGRTRQAQRAPARGCPPGSADRAAQPSRARRGRPRARRRTPRAGVGSRSRCSTSTGSRPTTTISATSPAIMRCSRSRRSSPGRCARATSPTATAGRSSCSSSMTSDRARRWPPPSAFERPSPAAMCRTLRGSTAASPSRSASRPGRRPTLTRLPARTRRCSRPSAPGVTESSPPPDAEFESAAIRQPASTEDPVPRHLQSMLRLSRVAVDRRRRAGGRRGTRADDPMRSCPSASSPSTFSTRTRDELTAVAVLGDQEARELLLGVSYPYAEWEPLHRQPALRPLRRDLDPRGSRGVAVERSDVDAVLAVGDRRRRVGARGRAAAPAPRRRGDACSASSRSTSRCPAGGRTMASWRC